jgi:hypothetical protein
MAGRSRTARSCHQSGKRALSNPQGNFLIHRAIFGVRSR